MRGSCKVDPEIRNMEGNLVKSELFKQLTSIYQNRAEATSLYRLSREDNFMRKYEDSITKDKNGEPTIESFTDLLSDLKVIDNKHFAAAHIELNQDKFYDTIDQVLPKIEKFNSKGSPMIATYTKEGKYYKISIIPKTAVSNTTVNDLKIGKDVSTTLINGVFEPLGYTFKSINPYSTIHGFGDPLNAASMLEDVKSLRDYSNSAQSTANISIGTAFFLIDGLKKYNIGERLITYYQTKMSLIRDILGEDFSVFEDYYKGDVESLAKEAAARELVNFLSGKDLVNNDSRFLLTRVVDSMKTDFNFNNKPQYLQTVKNAENILNERPLVYGQEVAPKLVRNSSTTNKVIRIRSIVSYFKELSEERQKVLTKRAEIFKGKPVDQKKWRRENAEMLLKMSLENSLQEFEEGNIALLEDAIGDGISKEGAIIQASRRLDALISAVSNGETLPLDKVRQAATLIRDLRVFINSYRGPIEMMIELPNLIKKGMVEGDQEWVDSATKIAELALKVKSQIDSVEKDANSIVMTVVTEALRPYFKHSIVWPSGKYKGQELTIEVILSSKDKDIGFLDRFLNSASDTDDIAIQIFDKMIKVAKIEENNRIIEIRHKIASMEANLRASGENNTKFMFEYTKEGVPTGDLISEEGFSYSKYKEAKDSYKESLVKQGITEVEIFEKMQEWESVNSDWKQSSKGTWTQIPKIGKYPSNAYSSLNAAQKAYYIEAMKIKEELDILLPKGRAYKYTAIQKLNSFTEIALGNASNTKSALKGAINSLGDSLVRREDDDEFGVVALEDFNGNKIEQIPIYYTNKLKDPSRLSLDFSSSLLAYSAMAVHFEEMNKIADVLELGRDVMAEREIARGSKSGGAYQNIKSYITNKTYSNKIITKGVDSMTYARFEDLLTMNLYGQVKKDQGSIQIGKLNMDIAKAFDAVTSLTSIATMGGNLFQGLNNMVTGNFQMVIEGMAGEYFNMADVAVGDARYFSLLTGLLAEAGTERNTSTLGLIQEKFNIFQDYGNPKNADFYKGTLARLFGKGTSPYLLNVLGENWMQTRTLLAYMNAVKLKDKNGATIRLLDAYEKVDILNKGVKVDARLQLKEGITKQDGTAFTVADEAEITLRVAKINQTMHGIYNEDDKNHIQKYAIGRMAMQFRKWMIPHYSRRFRGLRYDLQLDQFKEGYYLTSGRLLRDIGRHIINAKQYSAVHWKNLSNHERSNIKRAATELGTVALMYVLMGLVLGDYDDQDTWAGRVMMYQLHRWSLELNTSIPNPYTLLKDGLTLLNSPVATLNTFEDILGILKFWEMGEEIQSGKYEGDNKWVRGILMRTPVLKQAYRIGDITTEDYMFKALESH